MSHTYKNLAIIQVYILTTFFCFGSLLNHDRLFLDFGFEGRPVLIGFLLAGEIMGPFDSLVKYLMNLVSRAFEFQADEYAFHLGYGEQLSSGLLKLQKENKSNMNPDPMYSAYHHSHPPLRERLQAIKDAMASQKPKGQ